MKKTKKNIKIKLLHPDARIPERGTEKATGYDINCVDLKLIQGIYPIALYTYYTGFAIQPPEGYYFEFSPRSSVFKTGLILANSYPILDEDYRGEYIFKFWHINPALEPYKKGDRIGQLILRKREEINFQQTDILDETIRGEGGFGSTGI